MILGASNFPIWLQKSLKALNAILLCAAFFAILMLPALAFAGPLETLFVACSFVACAVIRICIWSVRCWTENPAPPEHKVLENNRPRVTL